MAEQKSEKIWIGPDFPAVHCIFEAGEYFNIDNDLPGHFLFVHFQRPSVQKLKFELKVTSIDFSPYLMILHNFYILAWDV